MPHGRQLRLFLADGTGTGPRFYEIVNRTIQSLAIPAVRIAEAHSSEWSEFQRPGVYLVYGLTEEGEERLYIGKGENVGSRVQAHPEKQPFEVTRLLLFSSKDENLNASQVGWLESSLVQSVKAAKRIVLTNANSPKPPSLSKAEHATVSEFYEDLELIALTAGFDIFEQPKSESSHASSEHPTFHYSLSSGEVAARLAISDEGYVVLEGSQASATISDSLSPGYAKMRKQLIDQGVLVPDPASSHRLVFSKDHVFAAPSPAACMISGSPNSGNVKWKTEEGMELGTYVESLAE